MSSSVNEYVEYVKVFISNDELGVFFKFTKIKIKEHSVLAKVKSNYLIYPPEDAQLEISRATSDDILYLGYRLKRGAEVEMSLFQGRNLWRKMIVTGATAEDHPV